MILQVKNLANYEQSVTLHTGEAKNIESGLSLRINTGTDKRLINYYVSLINYNFDVSIVNSSDEEANNFYDSIKKFNKIKNELESKLQYQDDTIYPINTKMDEGHITAIPEDKYDPNPNVLPDNRLFKESPHRTYLDSQQGLVADKIEVPSNAIVSDIIETADTEPRIIEQEFPNSEVVVSDQSNKDVKIDDPTTDSSEIYLIDESDSEEISFDDKYKLLDTLDESVLRTILSEKFGEVSRARTKWKVAYRIIELADSKNMDVQKLYNEYN